MRFTIENSYVLGLASWLAEQELSGKESRVRTRFVKQLADRHQETDKFRQELLDKYAKKDEKGERVVNEQQNVVLDDVEGFTKEINDLYQEEFTIDLDEKSFEILKNIVLNTDYVFGPKENDNDQERLAKIRQANDYEEWCQAFEVDN